jgi:hypothetical protein
MKKSSKISRAKYEVAVDTIGTLCRQYHELDKDYILACNLLHNIIYRPKDRKDCIKRAKPLLKKFITHMGFSSHIFDL